MPTIKLSAENGPASITAIDCGSSSPRLGGTLDVSAFPNLTSIKCVSNGITKFQGYGPLTNLVTINLADNAFDATQGNFETLSNKPNLKAIEMQAVLPDQYINWTGTFPDLSSNLNLETIRINNCSLTGNNLDFSMLTKLKVISIQFCLLGGAFPLLPKGPNSPIVQIQFGNGRQNYRYTDTTAPNLATEFPNCNNLVYSNNNVTGSIQAVPSRMFNFWCDNNQHTGSIPSLSSGILQQFVCRAQRSPAFLSGSIPDLYNCTVLRMFRCDLNRLTSFAGGVRNTLGDFQAQNNQLTSTAVNAILAAFVAAGRSSANANSITPGYTTCTLNLGGTGNAVPTGQGLIDKATLAGRGWSISTN